MKITSKILFILIVITLGIFFSFNKGSVIKKEIKNTDEGISYIQIGDEIINVDLADTDEKRAQGLSGRESLADGEGMLFIFPKPDVNYFWMKDMNFAIDMIWLNENKKIIHIARDVKPETFPKHFGPNEKSKYVIEVLSGFTKEHGITVGDAVFFYLPSNNS